MSQPSRACSCSMILPFSHKVSSCRLRRPTCCALAGHSAARSRRLYHRASLSARLSSTSFSCNSFFEAAPVPYTTVVPPAACHGQKEWQHEFFPPFFHPSLPLQCPASTKAPRALAIPKLPGCKPTCSFPLLQCSPLCLHCPPLMRTALLMMPLHPALAVHTVTLLRVMPASGKRAPCRKHSEWRRWRTGAGGRPGCGTPLCL